MFRVDDVTGWTDLVTRLDRVGTVTRWAVREPALAGLGGVHDLSDLTAQGADADRSDEVLGALVRLAAADGGNDPDAVLVLLHLLEPGFLTLARRLANLDRNADMSAVVVGQLVVEIRTFPWRRRSRAYAANLLMDTRRGVLHEFGFRRGVRVHEHLVADDEWWDYALRDWSPAAAGAMVPVREPEPVEELAELLHWAARRQVADVDDLRMVWELERLAGYGAAATARVAAEFGLHVRTVRRRHARVIASLQAAVPDYLAA